MSIQDSVKEFLESSDIDFTFDIEEIFHMFDSEKFNAFYMDI